MAGKRERQTDDARLVARSGQAAQRRRLESQDRSAVGKCTKYTLFVINFLLLFCGIAATSLGAYILVIKDKTIRDAIDFFLDPACDLCLAGSIILTLAFFGCLGSLREITCCLRTYYYTLCLFLLAELALGVLMFVSYYVDDVKHSVFPSDAFKQAIVHYRDDPDMQHLIDSLQQDLGCCGLSDDEKGYMDWIDNVYFNCSKENASPERCSVPYSCCRTESGDNINYQCGAKMFTIDSDGTINGNDVNTYRIYTDGCIKALGDWIEDHALIVGGVMLGVLVPQIFVVVLSRNLIDMIHIQKSKWL